MSVDPDIHSALDRALAIRNQDERLAAYREIDRMLVSETVTFVPLHYDGIVLAARPGVPGRGPNQLLVFGSPLDWITVDEEAQRRARAS